MSLWQFLTICGIGFVILELFTPSMFFLNFAVAAFVTAVVSVYTTEMITLVLVFFALSFISFIFLRPLILRKMSKETETGINDKYIGKSAKVVEDINENGGVISIYDERWNAKSDDGSSIPAGQTVQITRNEGLTLYVKQQG